MSKMTPQDVIDFGVERWMDEVKNRPLQNVYRSALDTAWRQVIRFGGGDPEMLLGPTHQDLIIARDSAAKGNPET